MNNETRGRIQFTPTSKMQYNAYIAAMDRNGIDYIADGERIEMDKEDAQLFFPHLFMIVRPNKGNDLITFGCILVFLLIVGVLSVVLLFFYNIK